MKRKNAVCQHYFDTLREEIVKIPLDSVRIFTEMLLEARQSGKNIFLMGNGGSNANASHFACDLAMGLSQPGMKRFKAQSLGDCSPLATAISNDLGYEFIFVEQLVNSLEKDDLVVAISGSGNSANLVKAIEAANRKKAITVGLLGSPGGTLRKMVDLPVIAPSSNMERIEDIHAIIFHAVKTQIMVNFNMNEVSCD